MPKKFVLTRYRRSDIFISVKKRETIILNDNITLEDYRKTFLTDFVMSDAASSIQDLIVYDCGREQCVEGKWVQKAKKPYYLFHYICSGKGTFIQNGEKYEIRAGEMFVIFPKCVVEYYPDKKNPWRYEWFSVSGRLADEFIKRSNVTVDSPVIRDIKNGKIREYVDNLVNQYLEDKTVNLGCVANLYLIFHELMEKNEGEKQEEGYKNSYINEAMMFMKYNICTKIYIKDIAQSLNLHPSYFVWLFTETVGMSPKQYLIDYRIKTGARLLLSENKKVEEVAKMVGYDDPLYFSREFKKVMGVSPRDYMRGKFSLNKSFNTTKIDSSNKNK